MGVATCAARQFSRWGAPRVPVWRLAFQAGARSLPSGIAWLPRDPAARGPGHAGCVGLGLETRELGFDQVDEFRVRRGELLAHDLDLAPVRVRGIGHGPEGADHPLDASADAGEDGFVARTHRVIPEEADPELQETGPER